MSISIDVECKSNDGLYEHEIIFHSSKINKDKVNLEILITEGGYQTTMVNIKELKKAVDMLYQASIDEI